MRYFKKNRWKAMYSVQVAMIVPIILVFVAICYDYMLYLNFKSGFNRAIHEYEIHLNRYLNLSSTEFINTCNTWQALNPDVRNAKSLFDVWHRGIDTTHLEERLNRDLARVLRLNLKDVQKLEIEFKSGFFKNEMEISYRIRANGLFRFSKKLDELLGDFRVVEGKLHLYQENIYMDIIHIDLIAKKLEQWDAFDRLVENVNVNLDALQGLF